MGSVAPFVARYEAGIDYLTCTAERGHNVAALLALSEDVLRQEVGAGAILKPWYWQGFGGQQAGGISSGFSGTRAIVRLSGSTARECAAEFIPSADNVSRLDIQLTIRADALGTSHAAKLYESLATRDGRRGRPIARSLIVDSRGGSSLYLGRRISDSYGRIYNKSAEEQKNETPPRWRYEVEYKRKLALAAARAYVGAVEKDTFCAGEVRHWFDRRNCTPPISTIPRLDYCSDARGSDSQSKLVKWLKVTVRPSVQRLALEYGWPDVLALLGVPLAYSDRYVNEVLGAEE